MLRGRFFGVGYAQTRAPSFWRVGKTKRLFSEALLRDLGALGTSVPALSADHMRTRPCRAEPTLLDVQGRAPITELVAVLAVEYVIFPRRIGYQFELGGKWGWLSARSDNHLVRTNTPKRTIRTTTAKPTVARRFMLVYESTA